MFRRVSGKALLRLRKFIYMNLVDFLDGVCLDHGQAGTEVKPWRRHETCVVG